MTGTVQGAQRGRVRFPLCPPVWLIIGVLGAAAWGQELPAAPSTLVPEVPVAQTGGRGREVAFWGLVGVYGGGILADGVSTQRMLGRGCVEGWSPQLFGRRPGQARFYLISGGMAVGEVLIARKLVRARSRWLRGAGWVGVAGLGAGRWLGVAHNRGMDCHKIE